MMRAARMKAHRNEPRYEMAAVDRFTSALRRDTMWARELREIG